MPLAALSWARVNTRALNDPSISRLIVHLSHSLSRFVLRHDAKYSIKSNNHRHHHAASVNNTCPLAAANLAGSVSAPVTPCPSAFLPTAMARACDGGSNLSRLDTESTTTQGGGSAVAIALSETSNQSYLCEDPPAREATAEQARTASPPQVMIFSDLYKSSRSRLARIRPQRSSPPAVSPYTDPIWAAAEYTDLLSKNKGKQKEDIKRYLSDKVKDDWEFPWPHRAAEIPLPERGKREAASRFQSHLESSNSNAVQDKTREDDNCKVDQGSKLKQPCMSLDVADKDDDAMSIYSIVSEDAVHYRPRIESPSDVSDNDISASPQPPRAENKESLHLATKRRDMQRHACRRRALRDEMAWNNGLACFEARRNAWTGARMVRVRSKSPPPNSTSPRLPRRYVFRPHYFGSPPSATLGADISDAPSDTSPPTSDNKKAPMKLAQDSCVSEASQPEPYPVETLISVRKPLLPPQNPLRASITPASYSHLYDKVVLRTQQPACPINLSDILRSCVTGWKWDGEWPPRPATIGSNLVNSHQVTSMENEDGGNASRRLNVGLTGREIGNDGRTTTRIRRSLRRALGIGHGPGHLAGAEREKKERI